MQKFHQSRALAMLGALILCILVWPICCCAAKPTWSPLVTDAASPSTDTTPPKYPNQTYQNLMTASGFSDNVTDKRTDFLNTQIGNTSSANLIDKGQPARHAYVTSDGSVARASESMTTSIYELFDLRKGNRKFASGNQILSRTDRSDRSVHLNSSNNSRSVSGAKRVKNKTKLSTLERNERSAANLSHITGSARKIQLYIKNRFLQLLPDGSVNGTTDDLSDYSKFNFSLFAISPACDIERCSNTTFSTWSPFLNDKTSPFSMRHNFLLKKQFGRTQADIV